MTSVDALDLSVAIVSYNTRALVLDCLKSVFETSGKVTVEVILVDNNSRDGTTEAVREQYPTMQLIESAESRLFQSSQSSTRDEWRSLSTYVE